MYSSLKFLVFFVWIAASSRNASLGYVSKIKEFPELVGKTLNEAKKVISKEVPHIQFEILRHNDPQLSVIDGARIVINDDNVVVDVPRYEIEVPEPTLWDKIWSFVRGKGRK